MLRIIITFFFFILIATTTVSAGKYRVIPGTGFFVDELSENEDTHLFHGVNIVHKAAALPTITEDTVHFIKSMGFNIVRYGILWTNIQPSDTDPTVFNYTYLTAAREQIDFLGKHGIRVFLDLHQDCFSSRFSCGKSYDGVPFWAATPPYSEEYYPGGNKSYPLPFAKPNWVPENSSAYNPLYAPWGEPASSIPGAGCDLSGWAQCYPTYSLGATVQRFYDNVNGTADLFATMWAEVARVFKGDQNVVGFEKINEPWLGEVPLNLNELDPLTNPKYWDLWFAGVADRKNLAPFYDRVAAKIRSVDPDTPIFFEPASGGSFLEGNSGFLHGPGGKEFDVAGKNVFSYHVYCPIIQSDGIHFNISNAIFNFIKKELCDVFSDLQLTNRANEVTKHGFGGFLSEFGAIPNKGVAADYMENMMSVIDKIQHSFTFWEIHSLEGAPKFIQNALSRSYPQKVPGRVVQYSTTNVTTMMVNTTQERTITFEVEYILSARLNSSSQNVVAEMFLAPQAFPLGSGYTVEAFPPCCVHVSKPNGYNVVTVLHDMTKLPPQSAIALKFITNIPM